jgi:YesN/AraC family two-component response regulator
MITENDKDIEILQRLLPQNISQNIQFIVGGSSYRARSLASSLLATRKTPVALVLDADTDNESQIFERYDLIKYALNQASSGTPYQVFFAVPQIEIVFLQDKSLIEKIAQRQFNDLEWQLAQSKPKEFLETVFGNDEQINARIFENISEEEIKILQQHSLMQEIIKFLSSLIPFSVATN